MFLPAVAIGLLTACAAPKHNYKPEAVAISEPPINTEQTRTVGEEMVRQGTYKDHRALYLSTETKPVWAYTMFPGYYLKHGEDEDGEYFQPNNNIEEGGRIEKNPFADPYISVMTKKSTNELCVVTTMSFAACGNEKYEFRNHQGFSQDSFQQTLIYNGRVGNKINIGYREFSNNRARPAFNNNVEYDLSESKSIAYKGARIEVIDATNQMIRYRVTKNFNDAAQ
jgi:hypothetical protein